MNRFPIILLVITLLFSCEKGGSLFENPEPKKTGVDFTNTLTSSQELSILDYLYFYNGGGVSIGDINNDGLPDIFFTGNQVKNKLYLNKGDLKFEDISSAAGIEGNSDWNTGVTMADVNGDGLLDIYVCAVVGINGFNGFNELYINNGDNTFTESAAQYGLDFDSYSSNATFFDYDLDGDLDLYLLNHAVHTQNSFGRFDLRYERRYETGDKLLRNDNGRFIDVSEEAGIYGGVNGYGLGLAIADFNQDGYPDIYVGNDFHEDDYYYLNNGDGSFTESLKKYFGHTSRFSMGNDVADINNDGRPDFLSLDMLPEDEVALKSSEGDDNIQTQKMRIDRFGYHYQFTRNMLFVNQPDGTFMETALMSGVAATDWSWSALFGDYDLDGHQDVFISNGIPKRPNDLDFIKFVSNDQIQQKMDNTKLVDQQALDLMPTGNVHNYVFRGGGDLHFQDMSEKWITKDTLVSGATAIGDLDNDGDLDLVTNNINQPATFYINKTNDKGSYLKLKFNYSEKNTFGIGTKVYSYQNGSLQFKELFPTRGFQASSEPMVHFGYKNVSEVDSIKIIWPDKTYQVLQNVPVNQTLTVEPKNTRSFDYNSLRETKKPLFSPVDGNLGLDFTHAEDNYTDFNREKLIPYQISDRGPALAVGDLNGDRMDDIFFGGSKYKPSQIFVQQDSIFVNQKMESIQKDSIRENVSATIADFNNDGKNDLITTSGGGDFFGKSEPLLDAYYIQKDTFFENVALPEYYQNSSVIKPFDFDSDGDLDVFIGGHTITAKFGAPANSYLLENKNGTFKVKNDFEEFSKGMVTDAIWSDFDGDGNTDLILVGEWMSPKFLKYQNGSFTEVEQINISGLWQAIETFDIDGDGDTDYLLGNWGTNSKFKASEEHSMKLYFNDFDDNGQTETVTAMEKNGNYYPLETLDGLASQMVYLKKKYTTYESFAGDTMEEIFGGDVLNSSTLLEVDTLKSGYLRNDDGNFVFVPFKNELQVSPIMSFLVDDFDGDGNTEVLVGGNYFGVKPYHGRLDSFPGALIKSERDIVLGNQLGLDFTQKSIRHLKTITLNKQKYLLAVFNNDKAQVYKIND
ncbi:FG-GAP repeat protein [Allomuricauda ruestringensis DSM 13258]|uniref:FG-GAP repeat protein n=1 Tax=Allomuricauda ruestringensis (strain DSM 13258 / CIP 107369 / LMG 19739 / B1) TaxID=886377 RepID=G2PLH1_ALLRU|nr:VCBS repeat-containing protein [Allomuricauda ruestringensis]AEM70003.1 FG-GAP repeat protein [Allomuricauda ruestringensis DSM 13258]